MQQATSTGIRHAVMTQGQVTGFGSLLRLMLLSGRQMVIQILAGVILGMAV
jgi:hypothetical protein